MNYVRLSGLRRLTKPHPVAGLIACQGAPGSPYGTHRCPSRNCLWSTSPRNDTHSHARHLEGAHSDNLPQVAAAFPRSAYGQPESPTPTTHGPEKTPARQGLPHTPPHGGAGSAGRPLPTPRRRLLLRAGSVLSRSRSAASFRTITVSQKEATAFHAVSSANIASTTLGRERSCPILLTRIPRSRHHAEHCSSVCCAESESHPQ